MHSRRLTQAGYHFPGGPPCWNTIVHLILRVGFERPVMVRLRHRYDTSGIFEILTRRVSWMKKCVIFFFVIDPYIWCRKGTTFTVVYLFLYLDISTFCCPWSCPKKHNCVCVCKYMWLSWLGGCPSEAEAEMLKLHQNPNKITLSNT